MTHLGTIIILLVCIGVGYILEPMFFSGVKQNPTPPKPVEEATADTAGEEVQPDTPEPEPEPEIEVDLSKIIKDDFPEKVQLKLPFTISDPNSGVTMQLKKGSKVKPIRLEGKSLVIQPVGLPIESNIDVSHTDFIQQAAPKMLERLKNAVAQNDPPPSNPAPAEPADVPTPPAPAPEPTPEPEPEPEPAAPAKLDEAAIVALLKQDVAAGNVTEFKANQVTAWKAGEDIEFDGDTYQTGRVTFKAETILGVQQHEAIALIEDGKVYKWMWAKTKLEMR